MNRKERRTADAKQGNAALQNASPAALQLLSEAVRLHLAGNLSDAEQIYRQILQIEPCNADALHLLGVAAYQTGRHDLAVDMIGKAIVQNSGAASFHKSHGNVYLAQGKWAEATSSYGRALSLKPDDAEAHKNLGGALEKLGRLNEAAVAYEKAVSLKPDMAEVHGALGNILQTLGRFDAAITSYGRALVLKPDLVEVHNNLGTVLREQGRMEEAIASYRRALALKPDLPEAHNNLLMTLHYVSQISNEALLSAARHFGVMFNRPAKIKPFANLRDRERRLRIGYVSGDFRYHPVGFFLTRVLRAHDRERVEIFCYSNSMIADAMTERLRETSDHWSNIAGMPDAVAASLIECDGIDILVDLSGHTADNRLLLFALRPAPVQVSWLGFFGTTGLAAMDYVLMDSVSVPAGEERWYVESVARLPRGRFCYEAPEMVPAPSSPPVFQRGHVTFGSFNNIAKLGLDIISLWARVLQAVPRSRLVLKWKSLGDESPRQRLREAFAAAGVTADRLEFRGGSPHHEMLAEYADIDIALDPFPFGGGLTSCEALWMGVPVVTLPGDRPASRQTLSFLQAMELEELAAVSPSDYVALCVALAADPDRLSHLRQSLRARMAASPICDGPSFTRAVEVAYRDMWHRWCDGSPAVSFDVSAGEAEAIEPQLAGV